MTSFLLGLYVVAVGLTGNTGGLLYLLAGEAGFIPWIVAIGIGYYAWENVSGDEREPVHVLILTAIAAVAIKERAKIVSGLQTAWSDLNSLGTQGGQASIGSAMNNGLLGNPGWNAGSAGPNPTAFLQSIFPAAASTAAQTGIPVQALLGQAALETGWGSSPAFQNLNNVAGINIPGGNGTQYQSFSSPAASFNALGNLVTSQYPNAIGGGVTQYAQALQAGGYATDPLYASKLIGVANSPLITNFLANQSQPVYNGP